VCMGRQVFAHANPGAMAKALVLMVHNGASADEAMEAAGL
jgi:DhnA family fructose-bisphosphate aldolase class Ia